MHFLLKYIFVCLAFFLAGHAACALTRQEFRQQESLLRSQLQRVAAATDTAQKMSLNRAFAAQLEKALRQDSSFFYPFDSIPYLYKVASTDGLVRLITWSVPLPGEQKYFGFVLTRKSKSDAAARLTALRDKRRDTRLMENKELAPDEWFGALYTSLVERRLPYTNAPLYTLLGISPTGRQSNKKVVDVLNVSAGGECTFGAPVFVRKGKVSHRLIFEYSAQAVMELRYREGMGMIVFSNLVPMYAQLRGRYEHYVPGEAFDGLAFENGQWLLRENVKPPSNIEIKKRVKGDKKRGVKG